MKYFSLLILILLISCSDDSVEADEIGIAGECLVSTDCNDENLTCLEDFKAGYCGQADCVENTDCPSGSVCVAHDNGMNYCFRSCTDKAECNENRSEDNEANCSSSFDLASINDESKGKACIPPSN